MMGDIMVKLLMIHRERKCRW